MDQILQVFKVQSLTASQYFYLKTFVESQLVYPAQNLVLD